MKGYRITYWEEGKQYTMVVGSSCYKTLRADMKRRFNRFTMERVYGGLYAS